MAPFGPSRAGFPARKPDWVRHAVLALHERHPGLSHRKLKDAFNQRYFAATGMSVGRTWVRDLLARQAHEALHARQECKHRMPDPEPCHRTWGLDTTIVTDSAGMRHVVFGIVDHGSRLSIALRRLRRFNTWTLLGALFLAFGEHGVPCLLRLDNHPVHRARRINTILRRLKVRLRFTALASPWQNGRVERFFGTFKVHLRGVAIRDLTHLAQALGQFRFWYNEVRPHQHLDGRTPAQVRRRINPYRTPPTRVL
jgi:transposase InsO family protein